MAPFACRSCGQIKTERYDPRSDWCVDCVRGELAIQAELAKPSIGPDHEEFEYGDT